MPGTLVGTINWKSSFNSQKDGDELCVTMKNTWEKRYGGLTIFFLAEKHRDPFDGERSKIVFDEFSKQEYSKRPCLAVERGLFQGATVPHLVFEGMTDLSSRDHRRNARIVSLLDDYRKEEKSATIVIFFYGEEHLEPIKSELITNQPAGTNIRWISSLSFDTVVDRLEFSERARFDMRGREPAGYTVCDASDLTFCYLRLLTKGQWFTRFMVPLWPLETARMMKTKEGKIFAIHFKDPTKNAQVKLDVDESGGMDYVFETFDGTNIAVAV